MDATPSNSKSAAGGESSPLDLRLDDPGTLMRPGPVGRLVRLTWGVFLTHSAFTIWTARDVLTGSSIPFQPFWWAGSLLLIAVFPYVVNIGFGVDWRAWPRRVLVGALLAGVGVNLILYQSFWSPALAWFVIAWQLCVLLHLGGSFLLAAAIATPGCEMRALPHLWTLVTGRETQEHYCPGHIDSVDRWEWKRNSAVADSVDPTNSPKR